MPKPAYTKRDRHLPQEATCPNPSPAFPVSPTRGLTSGSVHSLGTIAASLPIARDTDLDLLGLSRCLFLQLHLEDASIVTRLYILRIDRGRQSEGAEKAAVPALNAMEIFFLLLAIELALTTHVSC